MNLYQYAFGHQPRYVVASSFESAARTIVEDGESEPKRIDCLGPYVLVEEEPEE